MNISEKKILNQSPLAKTLQTLFGPEVSQSQKYDRLDQTDRDLEAKLRRYRELYPRLPERARKPLKDKLEKAFDNYRRVLDNFRETLAVRDAYQQRLDGLVKALKILKGIQFDFREALWEGSGPSTHPGLNQLLSLIEDQDLEELKLHLDGEVSRLELQEKWVHKQPEFLQSTLLELFREYRSFLEDIAEVLEDEDCWVLLEEIKGDLWEWGLEYSVNDLDGLYKRFKTAPSKLPMVNFALNARKLHFEGFLSEEVSQHTIDRALRSLGGFVKKLEEERHKFDEGHVSEYFELHTEVCRLLDSLRDVQDLEELWRWGQDCLPLLAQLHELRLRFPMSTRRR